MATDDPAADPVLLRIQERLQALGKSERGAAEAAGLSASAIRNMREGKSQSPRLDTIRRIAPVLEVSPEWLAFGIEGVGTFGWSDPDQAGATVAAPKSNNELSPGRQGLLAAAYAGTVEAGAFRAVEDFEDSEDRAPFYEPPDREYPELPLYYYDVAGDSMNDLKPRPIMPGDRIVALDFASLGNRVAIRDGMVVVVEQSLDGGHHRERSVKQVELYDDRVEFHPRSTNKRHKPIVVPRALFLDPSEADGREVHIRAVVRRVSNEVPL